VEGQPAKAHLQTWPRAIEAQELFEMAGCSKAGDGAREEYLLLIAASPDPDWTFVSPACKGLLQRYRPRTSEGRGLLLLLLATPEHSIHSAARTTTRPRASTRPARNRTWPARTHSVDKSEFPPTTCTWPFLSLASSKPAGLIQACYLYHRDAIQQFQALHCPALSRNRDVHV
jgi:hypothetical protein